jgi:hypothetical protein
MCPYIKQFTAYCQCVIDFFEAKNNDSVVYTLNEPFLQKVRLLEEFDEVQKNSNRNIKDIAIASKLLKQA